VKAKGKVQEDEESSLEIELKEKKEELAECQEIINSCD